MQGKVSSTGPGALQQMPAPFSHESSVANSPYCGGSEDQNVLQGKNITVFDKLVTMTQEMGDNPNKGGNTPVPIIAAKKLDTLEFP